MGCCLFCPKCGVDNGGSAQFCEKCGFQLPVAAAAGAGYAAPAAGGQQYVPPPYDDRMRMPGASPQNAGQRYAEGKTPAIAVILSFLLSGLGQLYNGDFKKCFVMWGIVVVIVILAIITGGTAAFLGFGIWIWSMVDAYNVANRKAPLW